ncbi:hypothetical protein A3F00_01855 [Candidatus Daviesbacteria bacterium RIFCSPHIGHO2_12_FULL_37_11]|uniref:PEGA domain-containing protein n=1 Tax=Candidatus Daviesbacteria bacterium RIFCSPHIGHO2_12_FULL_37_11 TaxID=1797777 RepID=A0A1F5KDT7_9BACT|nr:MAG: hypothetical protein A2111_00910 [Candidatus Daviesbacteria bacterium GWA1_38_6]OGE17690.1 MAG: hypothetical protein A2769_01405 [Candidatus Daviesbacteria bacterium RIFCSPHIGHO2_01_FULL_37_27]OGE38935.1 MAG: hypothetical protein A3F00_01855 [Candidatus Daviesbacteria bacterium RIFCSPHIGHO2_12_FULL_37_11]OGE46148.1 MAG: hypothetical protein A3B39_01995 [Candidatus Daviesbacteria bacterium RIFCSPLOWO2_01_FULL_37_10]
MSKRFVITLITLLVIGIAATAAIFLAKGYTFSTKEKRIVGTGIITITSVPDAASVYIDGHLTTATNATVSSLVPKEYSVKVVKEGFISWEKKVEVKEGLVTDLKITLFPAIPTVYPLTFTGVKNPILSPDGSKLAYIVSSTSSDGSLNKKAGVWVWTLKSDQPIAFARGAEPHQIAESRIINYTEATVRWSPDSKQLLATVGNNNYLLNDNGINSEPRDITAILSATLKSWEEDIKTKDEARFLNIKNTEARKIASSSANLKWAPDETKFMYTESSVISHQSSDSLKTDSEASLKAEDSLKFKVYDLDTDQKFDIPMALSHTWLPDSRHIVLVEKTQISVVDFDGSNKAIIYAGGFDNSFVFAWPDSSRLVIINSLPTPTASEPNLYGINLK